MLRKIACNATNSAAIDINGNPYVWGAGKYGLLGHPKQKHVVNKPMKLNLKSEKLVLDYSSEQSFAAKNISFGQYHAAVVVNDINTDSDFNPLLYAKVILQDLKGFLMKSWESTVKKEDDYIQEVYSSEEFIIENTLRFHFIEQRKEFPFITVISLKKFLVNEAKLSFKDTVSFNRLFKDISDPEDEDRINLKELRDQLMGRRCGNGIVFCWGIVNDGRLGIELSDKQIKEMSGAKTHELIAYRPSITQFPENTIIVKVSCGNSYTLALSLDGVVFSWGLGNSGGLGLGELNISEIPQPIKYQKNGHPFQNISDIACGSNHCLALDQNKNVYSWGNGIGGRLGHGDETGENIPKEILALKGENIIIIEAGDANSACININNELYIWGVGLHGRLGHGQTSNIMSPAFVEDLKDQKVEDIALGSTHTICILRNGKALCWGASKDGKLGLETALDRNFLQPKEMTTLLNENIYQFAAGPFHTMALTNKGELYTFGQAKDGKLGYEDINPNVYIPRRITGVPQFASKNPIKNKTEQYPIFQQYNDDFTYQVDTRITGACEVVQIACGFSNTLYLINNGTIYTNGSNKYGQQGPANGTDGGDQNDSESSSDEGSEEEEGEQHNDKQGDDILPPQLRKRILEIKQQQDTIKPTLLEIKLDNLSMKIKYISAGYFHALAVTPDGIAFGWGRNDYGQIGVGKRVQSINRPTKIKSLFDKKIVMAAAGENHSLFLDDLGEVFSSGYNEYGELGLGMVPVQGKSKEDQGYESDDQKAQIETKIELTPKVIKKLECIGFIAAGKNHSVAIRTNKTKEKELKMYTWGCGWHGQTGHDTWQNAYSPQMVKVPYVKNVKFVMASCGSKHTCALDTEGKLWYFGQKSSVGKEDLDQEKQTTPARLELPHRSEELIQYIASGDDHNLAITTKGVVLGFGNNSHNKINSNKKEFIYFEPIDTEERGKLVACGATHSAMTDLKGVPYTWGNTANGRCGQKIENDEKSMQKESISNPTVIYSMKVLFGSEQLKEQVRYKEMMKEQEEKEEEEKQKNKNVNQKQEAIQIRFPIQKILKEQQQSLDEENLISQDRFLSMNFNKMVVEFHENLKEKANDFNNSFFNAQNAIISRVYTFPSKIEMLTDIKAELPKVIIRNKQYHEMIFTLLQVHPCYLIKWITKTPLNRQPKEVIQILKIIYGEKEMRNDRRILHCLMNLSKKIFLYEMQTYDLREILLSRTDSAFAQLFNLIFENQDENNQYINNLISSFLRKLQKYINKLMKNGELKVTKAALQSQFDYETVIGDENKAKAEQRIKLLIDFMKQCLNKMLKTIDPQLKGGSTAGNLSNETLSLIYTVKLEIQDKITQDIIQEDIDSYIVNLIYETLIKRLRELSYDKIKDEYWALAQERRGVDESMKEPDKEIFNFGEKKNLISILADHLDMYLKNKTINYPNAEVRVLKDFIACSQSSLNKETNYRKEISSLINDSPLNFDYLLIKDIFINSLELKNPTLTISVNDLITIYNSLVEKGEFIFVQYPLADQKKFEEQDPIEALIEALGGNPIEIKQNEKQFISEEMLEQKLNLEIQCRVLRDHNQITKCSDCNGPVTMDLIPQRRFKEAIDDKTWKCVDEECQAVNPENTMLCCKCELYRDEKTLPHDMIFNKYKRAVTDPNVHLFQQILLYIPILGIHHNVDDMIDNEIKNENKKKNIDYHKLKIIEAFKRYKDNDIFKNKNKNNYEDQDEEAAADLEAETRLLSSLNSQVEESYNAKKHHEKRIQEYQKLMHEIREKIGTFDQRNNQFVGEFHSISENAFSGCGSEFLLGEKQDIFAGKLHLKGNKKQAKNGGKGDTGQANAQLETFFKQLDKATFSNQTQQQLNYQDAVQNRNVFKSNFGFFGKYPLYILRQRKVLHQIEIHGKKLETVMKKSSYLFYDDGNNGYKVELIYEESDRKCLVFGPQSHEAIIETFNISKEMVAEMRRTFASKATIQFENAEFNVFEFVILLNEIKSKTYTYGISNDVGGKGKGMAEGGSIKQQEAAPDEKIVKNKKKDQNPALETAVTTPAVPPGNKI